MVKDKKDLLKKLGMEDANSIKRMLEKRKTLSWYLKKLEKKDSGKSKKGP